MVQTFSHNPARQQPVPDHAVEVDHLVKVYKTRTGGMTALEGISLAVPRGSFFGLLGPNGAGKSTLINILAGLVLKTSGSARIWGNDIDWNPRAAKAAIGVVPQELNIDPFFTPRELLDVQAGMYGVPTHERKTMEILDAVGLADKADAYARTLSGGMRRRLLVAKAMVHSPPVLVLDEPTAGVDIELRRHLWDYVQELNRRGTTILLTTHYLEEAERLCDRIAIINHGRLVACDTTRNLLARIDTKQVTVTVESIPDELPAELLAFQPALIAPNQMVFAHRTSDAPVERILDGIRTAGLTILDLSTKEADLEDIFLQLTSGQ